MLLPALGKAKTKAQGIACVNNGRQLMLGWTMYSGDNRDEVKKWRSPTIESYGKKTRFDVRLDTLDATWLYERTTKY
jgi:hypothetical protein